MIKRSGKNIISLLVTYLKDLWVWHLTSSNPLELGYAPGLSAYGFVTPPNPTSLNSAKREAQVSVSLTLCQTQFFWARLCVRSKRLWVWHLIRPNPLWVRSFFKNKCSKWESRVIISLLSSRSKHLLKYLLCVKLILILIIRDDPIDINIVYRLT
jgi:hypothetical protein